MSPKNLNLWSDANIISNKLNRFYKNHSMSLQLIDRLILSDSIKLLESIRDNLENEK